MTHRTLHVGLVALLLSALSLQTLHAENRDTSQEAANHKLVREFYEQNFNQHKVDAATKVMADDYIQHNPHVPNGKAAFVKYFTDYFKQHPEASSRIVRSAAQGDLVWLHVHASSSKNDRGVALVDIFRVDKGKIVEHWDVIQAVPETSANDNTMF